MQKDTVILFQCPLFEGINGEAAEKLLGCLRPRHKKYEKNSFVIMEGNEFNYIGVVLSGTLHIVQDDYWGNRSIVSELEPGAVFGESFVCGGVKQPPVSVIAAEQSEALLLDYNRILKTCSSACDFHVRLTRNLVSILARKNVRLMEKIEALTQRNTRAKILSYLSTIAKKQKSGNIELPFNRRELSEYLSVDRSALSAELCRMRDEGLLQFHKNKFQILPPAPGP